MFLPIGYIKIRLVPNLQSDLGSSLVEILGDILIKKSFFSFFSKTFYCSTLKACGDESETT